jgi:hypothetical protein
MLHSSKNIAKSHWFWQHQRLPLLLGQNQLKSRRSIPKFFCFAGVLWQYITRRDRAAQSYSICFIQDSNTIMFELFLNQSLCWTFLHSQFTVGPWVWGMERQKWKKRRGSEQEEEQPNRNPQERRLVAGADSSNFTTLCLEFWVLSAKFQLLICCWNSSRSLGLWARGDEEVY